MEWDDYDEISRRPIDWMEKIPKIATEVIGLELFFLFLFIIQKRSVRCESHQNKRWYVFNHRNRRGRQKRTIRIIALNK